MWYRAVRAFVITSLVLNAALAIAVLTAMASGLRSPSILDFAVCVALLFGFLNAVGDLIEAEAPVVQGDNDLRGESAGAALHIIRQRGDLWTEREVVGREGLEAFRSER